MDFVFIVCANAPGEACPILPGHPVAGDAGLVWPRHREGGGIRRGIPLSQEPDRDLHEPAAEKHRSSRARDEAARYRSHRGRNIRPGKGRLMQTFDLPRRLVAEALGTALLVATVV